MHDVDQGRSKLSKSSISLPERCEIKIKVEAERSKMKIKVEASPPSRPYHLPERSKMETQVEVCQMVPRICFYAQLEMANGRHGILL
jgi:hypothetical protein